MKERRRTLLGFAAGLGLRGSHGDHSETPSQKGGWLFGVQEFGGEREVGVGRGRTQELLNAPNAITAAAIGLVALGGRERG